MLGTRLFSLVSSEERWSGNLYTSNPANRPWADTSTFGAQFIFLVKRCFQDVVFSQQLVSDGSLHLPILLTIKASLTVLTTSALFLEMAWHTHRYKGLTAL